MKLYLTQANLIGIDFYIHREGLKISEIFQTTPPRKKSNALLAKKNAWKDFWYCKTLTSQRAPALKDHSDHQYFTLYPKRAKFDIVSLFDYINHYSIVNTYHLGSNYNTYTKYLCTVLLYENTMVYGFYTSLIVVM